MRRLTVLLLPALAAIPVARSAAQSPPDTLRDTASVACTGQTITGVEVRREPPRVIGGRPGWRRTILSVLLQHRTTEPRVVSDLVRLRTGDACTEVARAESERVLRAQPFLADARVSAVPDSAASGTRLVIETEDEIPLILSGSVSGGDVTTLRYGNGNLAGKGQLASLAWRQGNAFRDGFEGRYQHYHVFGGPNTLAVTGNRAPIGGSAVVTLARPFLTPLQRVALVSEYRYDDVYRSFLHADSLTRSLAVQRTQLSAGGVYRVARAGGGALAGVFVGALTSYEHVTTGDEAVHIDAEGVTPDPDPVITDRYDDFDRTRVAAVVGLTALDFMHVTGFDALFGPQDIGRGAQVTLRAGPQIGTGATNLYGGVDAYVGAGTPRSFVGFRANVEGEGRGFGDWGEVITSGRLAWYRKPAERRTIILGAEYGGAWRARFPYQVTLADRRAGLLGYRKSDLAGARRLVGRAEHRWAFRRGSSSFVGFGGALFAQVAKLWAGDVPYGATINPRASAGVSLLGAIPRNSGRTFRADFAVPIAHDHGVKWLEFRFSTSAPARVFWKDPGDVAPARAAAPSADVFVWP